MIGREYRKNKGNKYNEEDWITYKVTSQEYKNILLYENR